jgi:hypothetical protein
LVGEVVAQNSAGGNAAQSSEEMSQLHKPLLNCIRLLTRLTPFLFDNDAEHSISSTESSSTPTLFSLLLVAPLDPCPLPTQVDLPSGLPAFQYILRGINELLFLPTFTLPGRSVSIPAPGEFASWDDGTNEEVGNRSALPPQALQNRVEVLRLLIVLLSKSIYLNPQQLMNPQGNPILDFYTSFMDSTISKSIVCSLIHTVAKWSPTEWSLPNAISILSGSSSESNDLGLLSLHALCILITWDIPNDLTRVNKCASICRHLGKSRCNFIATKCVALLCTRRATNLVGLLPGKSLVCFHELLLLLYKLVALNEVQQSNFFKW